MDSTFAFLSLFIIVLIQNYAAAVDLHVNDDLTVALLHRVEGLENIVRQQDTQLKTLEGQIDRQNQEITALKYREQSQKNIAGTNLARGSRASQPHVAFSAYLDHIIKHVGDNAIIPFDKIVINDGGSYNNFTGVFTVPVDGVYLFTFVVNTLNEVWQLVVKLVVDGVNLSDATSDPKHDLQEVQGGNTVIVRVRRGQSVWLAAYNTPDTIVDGREEYRFSTLSGFLLYT